MIKMNNEVGEKELIGAVVESIDTQHAGLQPQIILRRENEVFSICISDHGKVQITRVEEEEPVKEEKTGRKTLETIGHGELPCKNNKCPFELGFTTWDCRECSMRKCNGDCESCKSVCMAKINGR